MRSVSLRGALTLVVAIGVSSSSVAAADTGALPGGNTITWPLEYTYELANPATDNGTVPQQPYKNPTSDYFYFNYAHCECASPNWLHKTSTNPNATDPGHKETQIAYRIQLSGVESLHLPLQLWTGSMCDDPTVTTRQEECTELGTIADDDTLYPGGQIENFNIWDVETPVPADRASGECLQRATQNYVWVATSTMQDSTLDYWLSNPVPQGSASVGDTQPPFSPTGFTGSGGENAIDLNWTASTDNPTDIAYYQALCFDDDTQGPALGSGDLPTQQYQTPYSLCGADVPFCFTANSLSSELVDAGPITIDAAIDSGIDAPTDFRRALVAEAGVDATPIDAPHADAAIDGGRIPIPDALDADTCAGVPAPFQHLDPAYLCGPTPTGTATSMRISGLTNGHHYHIALLTIDKSGNVSGAYINDQFQPEPVTNFWDDLHQRGSHVEGGFCLINDTFGDDSGVSGELRAFRDQTLASTLFGRWLTAVYNDHVAGLGEYVQGSLVLRTATMITLAPAIAFAIAWHHLTLPGVLALLALGLLARNRRRILAQRAIRITIAGTGAVIALLGAPHHASAQVDPYWDHTDASTAAGDNDQTADAPPAEAKWNAGIRVGPYTPQIDAQLGGTSPGPYKQMFGGYSVVPELDVDHVFYRGLGGAFYYGGSIGYLGKSANAFTEGSSPSDPDRPRSADTNSFHLIPISATVMYRFTYLDDEFHVPIIPYVKAGLAYDVWWIRAPVEPSGNVGFAQICNGTAADPMCTNRALGASAGYTATLGLAVRAERIDAQAASAMRDSGLLHAGFYAELTAAKVDGFGKSTKLSVGDNTFFAGVNFEF